MKSAGKNPHPALSRSTGRGKIPPLPPSRAIVTWLGGSFVITFLIILALVNLDIRLGEGFFAYRWSPVRAQRTLRMLPFALIAAGACYAVMLLARNDRSKRRTGLVMLILSLIATAAWIWFAPPAPTDQQAFIMRSPSSDGAFVIEAEHIQSPRDYLKTFTTRLTTSVEQMGGTRILSNPPGMTLLAYAVIRMFPSSAESPPWLDRVLIEDFGVTPVNIEIVANSLRVGIALMLMWMASGFVAYALGRLYLSPAGAAVFAIAVTFNPCTVHFLPGKDPAQLFTINAMLWAWLAGWQRRSNVLCALAGAIFVIGATFGLIHIWVALAVFVATVWHDRRAARLAIPAAIGALIVCTIAYVALDWNIPLTLLAVSRRWAQLQPTFHMSRPTWYLIGLPIFFMFVTPALWAMLGLSLRRPHWNFGTRLAACTAAVMLIIYFAIGMTYELPRLWVAFLPTLLLGLAIDQPLLRVRADHARLRRALLAILLAHLTFTALHWTVFDTREAEFRLFSKRYFN